MKKFLFFILLFSWGFFINCGEQHSSSEKIVTRSIIIKKVHVSLTVDPSYKKLAEDIDNYFTNRFNKGVFNGNILFAKDGKIVIKKSYGYADVRKKTPLELTSRFQLASASKPFTAFAIMLLNERGKLDFNDNLNKFIPNFPYKDISIQLLLSHRSGLAKYDYFADKLWTNKSKFMSNDDLVEMMKNNPHLTGYAPDKVFQYCNTNYALLASVIEKASKTKYKSFMENEIFKPLGMNNTYVLNIKDSNDLKLRVNSFDKGNKLIYDNFMDGVVGDKEIYSTVEDLFIFDQSLYSGELLAPEKMKEAFKPRNTKWKSGSRNYGFGWRIIKLDDGRQIPYHCGWWHGFRSYFIRVPENKGTIIVLNNSMKGSFLTVLDMLKLLGLDHQ